VRKDKLRAIKTAQQWLSQEPLYLDTETTGLDDRAEICDIAVVDHTGNVLLDTLVRPKRPIPAAATTVHGISNSDVAAAPTFADILPKLHRLVDGRLVIIYNAQYDTRMLVQSAKSRDIKSIPASDWVCAMELYAKFYGDWSNYRQAYTWQKLGNAARQCGIQLPDNLHRATADAELTRLVVQYIAASR